MKVTVLSGLMILVSFGVAQSQVFSPQSTGTSSPPSNSSSSGGSQQQQKGSDPILGNVLPLLDPSTETMMFEGQLWDINDNRILKARFEKYLNTPAATGEDDEAYRAILQGIRDALSPHNKARGGRPDMQRAVALLENAAQYDMDGRMCESLANAIYRVWLARQEVGNLEKANDRLRRDRKDTTRNYEIANRPRSLQPPRGDGENSEESSEGGTLGTISQAGEYVTRYTEIQAKITANEGKIALSEVESKLSFQALLVQYLTQRRFEHVIIGSR
ncbi:MAG: hypothetical protein AAF191_21330, partial [Verrucomicrobiota bacterium]